MISFRNIHPQVTSENIVYQLLDRVTVPELVTSIVDSQVQPYCDRHKLDVDVVLLNYVRVCDLLCLEVVIFVYKLI